MINTIYHDLDFYGNDNSDGTPKEYYNTYAVKNALLSFLLSKKGDYILNPKIGGILDVFLFKNLIETKKELIGFELKNAINAHFYPAVTIKNLLVTPNYTYKYWEIELGYHDTLFDTSQTLIFYTKLTSNLTTTNYNYQEISYEGENLKTFILSKKSSMTGKLLLYDSNFSCFVWGKYKFLNLTPSSSNLAELLEIVNLSR
jgi:hypothetical protein